MHITIFDNGSKIKALFLNAHILNAVLWKLNSVGMTDKVDARFAIHLQMGGEYYQHIWIGSHKH